ncbi:hypothetical protein AB8A05_29655 [Tardiphaga sp. 538_B7_N1_4]|uniref:hypothetical protein n=1 Tax=Tardiphaga sp. 538_B7_N1_4 TaxID=3240778 RepID=UPI003F1F498B
MEEPSEFQKSLVKEMTYVRGRILTSYAQVEFLLADIAVKLELKFPYLIDKRIKAVRRIAEREGYESYKVELEQVCDDLLKYDDVRKFMAHGFVSLTTDPAGNHLYEMLMYERRGEGVFELMRAQTTLPRLQNAAEDITRYVSHVVKLFERIYLEKKLEQ